MAALAGPGGTGSGGNGTAAQSSGPNGGKGTGGGIAGPSAGYGAKVAAKVKPNIVYPDLVDGNPRAEVRVRASADGTITSVQLVKSSGNSAWDDAVVRALHKTHTLPPDVGGRTPTDLIIGFRPRD